MTNSLNNIFKGVLTMVVTFVAALTLNAESNIVETVDNTATSYTINQGDAIVGVTRFESGVTVDATSVLVAAMNNHKLLGTYATTTYVYDGDNEWYPVIAGEGVSTTVMTDAEVTAAGLNEVAVYYINNEEKQLTIETGLTLEENDIVRVTYKDLTTEDFEVNEDGTITVPATATIVEIKDSTDTNTVARYVMAADKELAKTSGIIYNVVNCLQNIDENGAVTTEYTCGEATEKSGALDYDLTTEAAETITGYTYADAKKITDSTDAEVATATLAEDYEYTIKFYFNRNSYTLKYNAPSGFTSPANETVVFGASATTVPSLADGYVTYWTANDGSVYTNEAYTLTLSESAYSNAATEIALNDEFVLNADANKVITLTGAVEAKEYTITYEVEGGALLEEDEATKVVVFDDAYGTLPTPTKTGYDFAGWYLTKTVDEETGDVTYSDQVTAGSTVTVSENHNLYAKWTLATYNITYIDAVNGVNNVTNSNVTSYNIEDENITLGAATRTGYTFGGWYSDEELTNKVTTITTSEAKDVTLYAKWTGETISVTFKYVDADTNTVTKVLEQTIGKAWNLPTYAGHQVTALTDKTNDAALSLTKVELTENYNGEGNNYVLITYTNQFTVSYEENGGSAVTDDVVTYGSQVTLGTSTKVGYDLEGWYTDLDDASTKLAAGATIDVTENVTYYAKWTAKDVTVTLEANGGTLEEDEITVTYDEEYGTIETPTKEGYTFGGWFKEAELNNEVEAEDVVANENAHTLYAKWTAVDYTITYNLNGGENALANPETYTIDDTDITLVDPAKEGYTFGGWFSDAALTPANVVTTIAAGSKGDVTVYAKWTPTNYVITYDLNGGTNSESNPNTYTIETATITLAAPTKEGYTFTGWVDSSDNAVTEIALGSTGDKTFTANYVANIYTITLDKNNGVGGTDYLYEIYNVNLSKENSLTGAAATNVVVPTRTGYTFEGYYDEDTKLIDAAGTILTDLDEVTYTENVTLTAKWTTVKYDINYTLNGSVASEVTNAVSNPAQYDVETDTITLANPTRVGYTFGGWYSDALFTEGSEVTTIDTTATGAINLYAKWTANTYTILFDYEGVIANASTTATLDEPTYIIPSADRDGYTLTGYAYTSGAATVDYNKDENGTLTTGAIAKAQNGVITLYAIWTEE